MPADPAHSAFERVLAAVGQCLDRQSAEALLRLRADKETQGRIEDLADKSTEGTITPEEREEYEALIPVGISSPSCKREPVGFWLRVTPLDGREAPAICP